MPVNYDPDPKKSEFVDDRDSIGKPAQDEKARRRALNKCLDDFWPPSKFTIGCLERVENSVRWGWLMAPHRAGQSDPPE